MQERKEGTLYYFPQFLEVPELRYFMARTKLECPDWIPLNLSLLQAKMLVKALNAELFSVFFLPTSSQWTDIRQCLTKSAEGLSLLTYTRESLDSGPEEIVDSLLAYPNPETGNHSPRIVPPLPPSEGPYLIENSEIEFDSTKVRDVITRGTRKALINFPQTSGELREPIPELGLSAGTILFVNPDYRHEEGLRVIARGGYHASIEREGIRRATREMVSACYLFSQPSPVLGLRICAVTDQKMDSQKYTAILQKIR